MDLSGHTILYGGSFNPAHTGHQMACLYLLEVCGADAVWLVPVREHPFGKDLVDFSHRVAMCHLLARPFGRGVQVRDDEKKLPSPVRTYDLLQFLKEAYPRHRFAIAVGADINGEIDRWYRWSDIVSEVPVVTLGRKGYPRVEAAGVELPAISSTDIRERIQGGASVHGLLPRSVERYIKDEGLYL